MNNRVTGKDPDAGIDWRQEEKGTTENEMDMGLSKLWELVMDRETWSTIVQGVAKNGTRLSDWTELMMLVDTTRKINVIDKLFKFLLNIIEDLFKMKLQEKSP